MLHTLIQQLRSSSSASALLDVLLDGSLDITGAAFGNIQIMDWKTGCLEIATQRGFNDEFLKFFECVRPADGSACALALRARGEVIIDDVANDRDFSPLSRTVILAAGVRAVQSTPIISSSGALVGMLSTHFPDVHRPSLDEMNKLKSLARIAADATILRRARQNRYHAVAKTREAIAASRELLLRIERSGSI